MKNKLACSFVFVAWFLPSIVYGRGVDIGLCSIVNFACQCGEKGYTIDIPIKECTFFYRWKPYCKPCDEVGPEHFCSKYLRCLDCTVGASRCINCPPNRFGDWCTGECACKNGGSCNRHDGSCTCPQQYKGIYCEERSEAKVEIIFSQIRKTDCRTKGSTLIAENVGNEITLKCPAGCDSKDGEIWGEVIYHERSAVCLAAKHARVIGSGGGTVVIVNIGHYPFSLSNSGHGVSAEKSNLTVGRGFIFRRPLIEHNELTSSLPDQGEVDCTTTGRDIIDELPVNVTCPSDCGAHNGSVYGVGMYAEMSSLCLAAIHDGKITNDGGQVEVYNHAQEELNFVARFQNGISSFGFMNDKQKIRAFAFLDKFNQSNTDHTEALVQSGCDDPGQLENGFNEYSNLSVDGIFLIGTSITYSCDVTHHMRGGKNIVTCTRNLTWDAPKPRCLAVMCQALENDEHGTIKYIKLEIGNKTALGRRSNVRRPMNLKRPLNFNLNTKIPAEDDNILTELLGNLTIPEGFYPIGTKAIFGCKSKFYRLTSYKSRVCQTDGKWSGRDTKKACTPICGQGGAGRKPLLSNGNTTEVGQWPWHVGITAHDIELLFCGGTVISEKFIVTAAHCLTFEKTLHPFPVYSIHVRAGKYFFDHEKDDQEVQRRQISKIYVHPDYDPLTFDNDIALLELEEPFQFSFRVQPVCLPTARTTKRNIVDGVNGVVTGWGIEQSDESYPEVLKEAVMSVVSRENCERDFNTSLGFVTSVTKRMFCGGYKDSNVSGCKGDSGGPFVFLEPSGRRWVLEGIVSWAFSDECGSVNLYTGFTLVQKFSKWISEYVD